MTRLLRQKQRFFKKSRVIRAPKCLQKKEMETPIKKEIVDGLVAELGIKDFAKATIREVKQVAAKSEKASGVEFIKMEMGIPGLPAAQVGVDAQIKALEDGIAHS